MKNNVSVVSYINFIIDEDGEVSVINEFEVGQKDLSDDLDFDSVDEFVKKLEDKDIINISEHRTEVQVTWYGDNTMDIEYRYFNQPDEGDFDDHTILRIDSIPLDFQTESH